MHRVFFFRTHCCCPPVLTSFAPNWPPWPSSPAVDDIRRHVPQRFVQHIAMISPRFLQIGFSATWYTAWKVQFRPCKRPEISLIFGSQREFTGCERGVRLSRKLLEMNHDICGAPGGAKGSNFHMKRSKTTPCQRMCGLYFGIASHVTAVWHRARLAPGCERTEVAQFIQTPHHLVSSSSRHQVYGGSLTKVHLILS